MPPLPIADLASGLTGAFGICAAILGRGTTGEGTYLDVSMTDVMATWTGRSGGSETSHRRRAPVAGRAGLRPLHHRRRPSGCVGRRERGALLDPPLHRARPRRPGRPRFRRALRPGRRVAACRCAPRSPTQQRDELVATLIAAGVPASPVLDRQEMLAASPFPRLPHPAARPGRHRLGPTSRSAPRRGLPHRAVNPGHIGPCYVAGRPPT